MLGHKTRNFRLHKSISIEDLVPEDNIYRQVERSIDLSFVRDLTGEFYSSIGRPSIDPVVFFKLQLIAFFEGIRSERQLMDTVNVNLAHRWFIGYDLTEAVPDHSGLSKIRDRYGLATFQHFFERIVELCIAAGLVWGEELYFDSTKVQANADIDPLVPRMEWEAQQHLHELFEKQVDPEGTDSEATPPEEDPLLDDKFDPEKESATILTPQELVEKYDGSRLTGVRKPSYERLADQKVCRTDPDASPMQPSGGGSAVMGYSDHYVVDGGKQRIILHDQYTCPQGQTLELASRRKSEQVYVYKAEASVCDACPVKDECTESKSGRHIFRSFFQEDLDRVKAYQETDPLPTFSTRCINFRHSCSALFSREYLR